MPNVWNAIFLGNFATALDPIEDNDPFDVDDMENSSALVGEVFGSVGDPLANHIVQITGNDVSGEVGYLDVDNAVSNDTISYDVGAGANTQVLDAAALYDVTITYLDGTTATVTATILQDVSGNLFLAPETTNNADTAAFEAQGIRSIEITAEDAAYNFGSPGAEVDRYDTLFVCFVAGTMIETEDGPRPVEQLMAGTGVRTLDNGVQTLRWIGQRQAVGKGAQAPVRIRQGALGMGLPERDLWVSQQHRLLVRSKIAERVFGKPEVLIAAKKLAKLPGIDIVECESVVYCHFAFDAHEVVLAEGAPAESLYLGPEAGKRLGRRAMNELGALFPALVAGMRRPRPARLFAEGRKSWDLALRHAKNMRAVLG